MKQSSVKWFGYLFSFVFLIISCAGTETELTQNQVNEAYKGKPVSDILVIAITGNEDSRRSFEQPSHEAVMHIEAITVLIIADTHTVMRVIRVIQAQA